MTDSGLNELAKPVHIQRLEKSLRLDPFLDQVQQILSRDVETNSNSEDGETLYDYLGSQNDTTQYLHTSPASKLGKLSDKCRVYNFEKVGEERAWLKDVLLSDSSSSDSGTEASREEDVKEMLYLHQLKKKYQAKYHENPKNRQFMYYSAGMLSKTDIYPEHKMAVLSEEGTKSGKEKKDRGKATVRRRKKIKPEKDKVTEEKTDAIKCEASAGTSTLGASLTGIGLTMKDIIDGAASGASDKAIKKEPMDMADPTDFNFESDVDESDGLGLFENMTEAGSAMQSPSQQSDGGSPAPMSPSLRLSSPLEDRQQMTQEQKQMKKRRKGDKDKSKSEVKDKEKDKDKDKEKEKDKESKEKSKKEKGERKARSKKEKGPPSVKALIAQRRKLWLLISKKEISKASKARVNNHKEELVSCKRAATGCMRVCRLRAMQSQKAMKEIVWRAKRLTREMQSYWKRYDRVEKVQRRQAEKEAEEQRKLDVELMEARRQQRKLNFLITQTELYAHFMAKKLGNVDNVKENENLILGHLDEEANPQLAYLDDYDSQLVKQRAMNNVNTAFHAHQQRTQQFDNQVTAEDVDQVEPQVRPEFAQPKQFQGSLKSYQLKGMNWISNLYDEGINGILADEMGLGKTVQSIAFLAHIAERYGIWGPFLIISPASTLHNWQQELARFLPDFKVIPYWGSPQERKILRKFWDTRNLHTPDASFHVVVTSYQLIVTDFKYFNRIKWQYMVLDEAQAIKSSSSARWKMLLTFNCRNRLLLSGTPIQNSMAELWALLHFIMPTLFDSHEEFNEWFSKDIESHAENKTGIDEKHLSRLHMILKPFMLRRVKKDVENELSDKIEIMMYCPFTNRQRMLYQALKRKISIDDLLYSGSSSASAQTATTTLMNLVMQFRKVCNHPELFERREAKSPYHWQPEPYVLPKFIYRNALLHESIPSQRHLLFGLFYVWHPENTHRSLFSTKALDGSTEASNSFFAFSRLIGLSPHDVFHCMFRGAYASLLLGRQALDEERIVYHNSMWDQPIRNRHLVLRCRSVLSAPSVEASSVLSELVFMRFIGPGYAHLDHHLHSTAETIEHRILRSRKSKTPNLPEFPYRARPVQTIAYQWTDMPSLLSLPTLKVSCRSYPVLCSDRSAAYWLDDLTKCGSLTGENLLLHGSPSGRPAGWNTFLFEPKYSGGIEVAKPKQGWSSVILPDKETLISDAGKLQVLDTLLRRLKSEGHRVLIYSQMTRIIDLLEEYMWHRKWSYMRLDGSSKISERRDMVADFQTRSDIFVFLLSTRAGGLGINLTAADTVIFYDSDWNPTVDQQAMDRAHRLGQTKQVTVYRLICKGTIEERILQRAREKSKIQKIVISGGSFKPDTLKPTEVVSLLLDDEEIERKYRQRQAERKQQEVERETERKRKYMSGGGAASSTPSCPEPKRPCLSAGTPTEYTPAASPTLTERSSQSGFRFDETSNDGSLVVDDSGPMDSSGVGRFTPLIPGRQRPRPGRGSGRRGRPPGSGKRGRLMVPSTTGREVSSTRGTVEGEVGFLSPSETNRSLDLSANGEESTTPTHTTDPAGMVKRRPGRPRLRPVGPAHQGIRKPKASSTSSSAGAAAADGSTPPNKSRTKHGGSSGRRVIKPLQVPIGSMTANSSKVSVSASASASASASTSVSASFSPSTSRSTGPGFYSPTSP